MNDIISVIQGKDNTRAYQLTQEIVARSAECDEYYSLFEDFTELLTAKSSYIRTRGFQLCCAQARWDNSGKLKAALPKMLALLNDEKPTVVRQCLAALHEVALYRAELCGEIETAVRGIDLSRYKDSMAPLIKKDIDELSELLR